MPRIDVEGFNTIEARPGERLVRVLEANGVDILHRCGGYAKCTTCRVSFVEGEPDRMTQAEYDRLKQRELLGQYRLSCQILTNHDMRVQPMMTLSTSDVDDPGPEPDPSITPEPQWIERRTE